MLQKKVVTIFQIFLTKEVWLSPFFLLWFFSGFF